MGTKIIFIDTETGGIDCKTTPLLQISGELEVEGRTVETFDFHLKPYPGQIITDSAVAKTGLTEEIVSAYTDPNEVFIQFVAMLDKYVSKFDKQDKFQFVGYNSGFDVDFIRQFFLNNAKTEKDKEFGNGYGCYFWTPYIDVMQMAAVDLFYKRVTLPNFKLATVWNYYLNSTGQEIQWHDASADIAATKDLFWLLMNKFKLS